MLAKKYFTVFLTLGCGVLSYATTLSVLSYVQYFAAKSRMPFADLMMVKIDRIIGPSWTEIYNEVWNSQNILFVLQTVYNSTFLILLFVVVSLALFKPEQMWRVLIANAICGPLVLMIFALLPTLGPEHTLGLINQFPKVDQEIMLIREGLLGIPAIGPDAGLVFFPSYHTVVITLTVYGASVLPWYIRWSVNGWSTITLLAVAPIGGHYYVDILVGMSLVCSVIYVISGQK